MTRRSIAWFGSSLVSAYWNGAATYYRGIIRALHARGWHVTFYEPDACDRQSHRDLDDVPWADVVVYPANESAALQCVEQARSSDVVIKASGVGVFDELLEGAVLDARRSGGVIVYWDVDAPATLARLRDDPGDPLRDRLPRYDMVFTYGGGPPVVRGFGALGARACFPIYNAVDPETHFPVAADPRFSSTLSLLANRLPDRERRVHDFFFDAARRLGQAECLLGGNGWDGCPLPANVRWLGHVKTADHNAFNTSALAVLNIARDSMAQTGYSPATRVFEAAGAGACIVTDDWEGLAEFLEPGREVLVARDGAEVAALAAGLDERRARGLGEAARRRVLAQHTYERRGAAVHTLLCAAVGRERIP